jgi:hypothetical protein
MNMQNIFLDQAIAVISDYQMSNLLGVSAEWKNDTAIITYFFKSLPTEEEIETVQFASSEIIAGIPECPVDEIITTVKGFLPTNVKSWAYRR